MCSKLHNKQKHFQSFLFSIAASRSNGENESYQLLLLIKICYTMLPTSCNEKFTSIFGGNIFNRARFNELFNQHLNESVFRWGFNLRILLESVFVKHFLI